MTDANSVEPLRDAQRRVARSKIVAAAIELFTTEGYEQTTVERIAAAAGVSRRTFFRHFGSKEAVMLGKFDSLGETLVDALRRRPPGEDEWVSLHRMLEHFVQYTANEASRVQSAAVEAIIQGHDGLRAASIERMERTKRAAADVLVERRRASGRPQDPAACLALVGAAYACLPAAAAAATPQRPFAVTLDETMAALRRALTADAPSAP